MLTDPLVNVDWLAENIDGVRLVDGTWSMPNSAAPLPETYIKGAVEFDIDAIADPSSELAHMRPDIDTFTAAVSKMGINPNDVVVIYDRHGVFSAPRVWWTFRLFGHKNVYVLDGGLPAWVAAGHKTAPRPQSYEASQYEATTALAKVADIDEMLSAIANGMQIVDARPPGRFNGTIPEPRPGLASGHMPGATNIAFGALCTADSHFKPLEELRRYFQSLDLNAPIYTTCGSGITAAGLAFTLTRLGASDVRVYDGSWAEYGARTNVPIVNENT